MASTINAKNTSTGVVITPDASGQLELQTVDTTRMTITSSGNVGIGTNSPANRLQITGAGGTSNTPFTTDDGATGLGLGINFVNNTSPRQVNFQVNPDGSGYTTRMTIDGSGNVGIGTSSPVGSMQLLRPADPQFIITDDLQSSFTFGTTNGYSVIGTDAGYVSLKTGVTTGSVFSTGTERMRIDSSGNVLVGTTTSSGKLTAYTANADATDILYLQRVNSGTFRVRSPQGGLVLAGSPFADAVGFETNGTERMRLDTSGNLLFNSGYGSVATAYGCRAWVNFNGTGTVAIRASGNVSSITDNGVGIYTINFTNAMPDVNYAVCASGRYQTAGGSDDAPIVGVTGANFSTPTTSAVQIGVTTDTATGVDPNAVYVSVFR